MEYLCDGCGLEVERFVEGWCEDCHNERQTELNEHNAQFDFWERCTDKERDYYISQATSH